MGRPLQASGRADAWVAHVASCRALLLGNRFAHAAFTPEQGWTCVNTREGLVLIRSDEMMALDEAFSTLRPKSKVYALQDPTGS